MVHFDEGVDAFGYGEGEDFDWLRVGDGIAVHCENGEAMAGEREYDVFGGAGVEEAHEDALAWLDADGLACAEHVAVEGGVLVAYVGAGGLGHVGGGHAHGVDHGDEVRLPMADGEVDLLIVVAGFVAGFDEEEAELAGVGAESEIVFGCGVGVVPAGAGGAGREVITLGGCRPRSWASLLPWRRRSASRWRVRASERDLRFELRW